ncbi:MAG: hypothetical protein FP819_03640 [Rhizobiaceae bacterium]|nr:hypothetical protein [Rhizobiaceae bacterium]
MARRYTGLKNPLITPEANEVFSFPSLNRAEVDEVEVSFDIDVNMAIKRWVTANSLEFVEPKEPWTAENQVRVRVDYGKRFYAFVNPQHAMLFKLTFGGK